MIVCPNTSPLLVLARIERLDLLGDPGSVQMTRAVLDEVRDKRDAALERIEDLLSRSLPSSDPVVPERVDPARDLGPGERSVLAWALSEASEATCVLDDAAARAEARRLGIRFTGTLGLVLRSKVEGRLAAAAPLLREAVDAGLYLDDGALAAALARVGERWSR